MYDIIIMGAGAAAWAASMYAARRGLSVAVLSDPIMRHTGVRLTKYGYPGFLGIDAERLAHNMRKQAEELGVTIVSLDTAVQRVSFAQEDGKEIFVVAHDGGSHTGRAVIMATDTKPQRLNIPGEDALSGKGVMHYMDEALASAAEKPIACVVNSEDGLKAALRIALYKKTVFVFDMTGFGEGSQIKKRMERRANVTMFAHGVMQKIIGDERVQGVVYKDMQSGEDTELAVDEVCIMAGGIANSDSVDGVCERTKAGKIIIDPRTNATSHIGIFAAGEVTDIAENGAVIFAGDGARAGLRCAAWLFGQ